MAHHCAVTAGDVDAVVLARVLPSHHASADKFSKRHEGRACFWTGWLGMVDCGCSVSVSVALGQCNHSDGACMRLQPARHRSSCCSPAVQWRPLRRSHTLFQRQAPPSCAAHQWHRTAMRSAGQRRTVFQELGGSRCLVLGLQGVGVERDLACVHISNGRNARCTACLTWSTWQRSGKMQGPKAYLP